MIPLTQVIMWSRAGFLKPKAMEQHNIQVVGHRAIGIIEIDGVWNGNFLPTMSKIDSVAEDKS
jgi:hypothetical protein